MNARITVYKLTPCAGQPNYKLEWLEPGTSRRRSKSARTADEKQAEVRRTELEYELNHGLHADRCRLTWQDFSARYLEEKIGDRRLGTRKKWATVSDSFLRLAAPRTLADVTASMLSKYAAQLRSAGLAKATVAGHLAYLRAALRWAARLELLKAAPAVEMPKLPRKSTIRKTDAAGFLRILNAAPLGNWRLFISTAWHTGMRRGELLALEWDGSNGTPWVDLARERIWLPAEWCKSDADSWLPIHPDLLASLQAVALPAGRLFALSESAREVSRTFTKIAKAAGLGVTLHDLRRSFGSRYAAAGVSAPVLQRMMRHSDVRTTLAFYVDIDDELEKAIRIL